MLPLEAQMQPSASRQMPSGPTPSAQTRRFDSVPSAAMSKAVSRETWLDTPAHRSPPLDEVAGRRSGPIRQQSCAACPATGRPRIPSRPIRLRHQTVESHPDVGEDLGRAVRETGQTDSAGGSPTTTVDGGYEVVLYASW